MKQLKNMWVCLMDGTPKPYTISYSKKSAIQTAISNTQYSWIDFKKFGWRCIKVNISFEEVKQ